MYANSLSICLQETWYTPPSKQQSIAGGKLSEKLRNTWRNITKAGLKQNPQPSMTEEDIGKCVNVICVSHITSEIPSVLFLCLEMTSKCVAYLFDSLPLIEEPRNTTLTWQHIFNSADFSVREMIKKPSVAICGELISFFS
jgi:hypothetical protein